MQNQSNTILVTVEDMQLCFENVLEKNGFLKEKAKKIAEVFTQNSVDGIYTHGVNRFTRFVDLVQKGFVQKDAAPSLKNKFNCMEQWDGNLGPGILNAIFATDQSMKLASEFGLGCVTLSNTNHWMRGGSYGWQAANKGCVFIGWTNTIANMPAWGAKDARLGNNPLVMALPYNSKAIVLDMAMSQFSFGAMELSVMKKEKLPVYGGFDKEGLLSDEPSAILESGRPIPIGYWKGAGLSLLLDLLGTVLSGGLATHEISKKEAEYSVSQVFIAIDISKLGNHSAIAGIVENIISNYHQSLLAEGSKKILYPGERLLQIRKNNLANGIPVMKGTWDKIEGLL